MAETQKILLINFTENVASKVATELGVVVHRGYMGKKEAQEPVPNSKIENVYEYYVPNSIAEYKAIFINVSVTDNLKKELLSGKTTSVLKDDNPLFKYWYEDKGYLTLILNDKSNVSLKKFGIPMEQKEAEQTDTVIRTVIKEGKNDVFSNTLKDLKKSVVMPSPYYLDFIDIKDSTVVEHTDIIYRNASDDNLGVYYDDDKEWADRESPRYIILPKIKNPATNIIKLLLAFSQMSPKFLQLTSDTWMEEMSLYPDSVQAKLDKIDAIKDEARSKISDVVGAVELEKEFYSALKGILTQTGTPLVTSVMWVLTEVLKLNAKLSDDTEEGKLKEDIFITLDDEPVLAEVKGTKAENPSPKYFGQATNHVANKFQLGVKRCILIVNHDMDKDPTLRTAGYSDDSAQILENSPLVSYVDTRILHRIALDVLNGTLTEEKARSIFLGKGRVQYSTTKSD